MAVLAGMLWVPYPARAAGDDRGICPELREWKPAQPAGRPRWSLGADAAAQLRDAGDQIFDLTLVSPVFVVPPGGLLLRWKQEHTFSWAASAGVLEIAVDGGAWQDLLAAGGRFLASGYGSRAFAGNPLGARPAWGGVSGRGEARAALPTAAKEYSVQLRFRAGSSGTGDPGQGWLLRDFDCETR